MEVDTGDYLYYIWFAVLLAVLVLLFFAKLRFDKLYEKRQDRRKLLSYSKSRLAPNEEGMARSLKVKKLKDLKIK